jgi:hypothetical protein
MAKECKAPEAIPGMPKEVENVMGDVIDALAEKKILDHYCRNQGFNQFTSIFPMRNFDGTQIFEDVRGLNTMLLIAFLKLNNPAVNEVSLATQATMAGGGIKNPDFWTHSPARPAMEFYEIKPNSASGLAKGAEKITKLQIMCLDNKLPYIAGVNYFPNEEEVLWIENKGFITTTISLHWIRRGPGLLVYEICRESRLRAPVPQKVVKAVEDAAMLALMLAMMVALGIADLVFG